MGLCACAYAQDAPRVTQFYGFVLNQDSSRYLFGAHIFNPRTRRGTSSNLYGYFSLPVRVGDTMRITHQGFFPQDIIIPFEVSEDSYAQLIYMRADTILLAEVEVRAFMSKAEFKRSFLSMRPEIFTMTNYLSTRTGGVEDPTLNYFYSSTQQQQSLLQQQSPSYVSFTDWLLKPLLKSIREKKRKQKKP